jgi:hypothetical protein
MYILLKINILLALCSLKNFYMFFPLFSFMQENNLQEWGGGGAGASNRQTVAADAFKQETL